MTNDTNFKMIKRNAKSSIFTNLFSKTKYKKELYVCLHPKDKNIDVNEIKIWTLSSIFTNIQINDLGLLVRDKLLVLVEAQSTWTVNILPRMIGYIGESFNRYIIETKQNIYGSKKVTLPMPELYVLYTGRKNITQKSISFKKEYFNDKCPIDVKVKIITINNSNNIIQEYIKFTKIFDENNKKYGYTKRSIEETINKCINSNILKNYIEENKKEVYNIMTSVYDQTTATEMYKRSLLEEGRNEGLLEGRLEGRLEGKSDLLIQQYKENIISKEYAAKALNISVNEFMNKL